MNLEHSLLLTNPIGVKKVVFSFVAPEKMSSRG